MKHPFLTYTPRGYIMKEMMQKMLHVRYFMQAWDT